MARLVPLDDLPDKVRKIVPEDDLPHSTWDVASAKMLPSHTPSFIQPGATQREVQGIATPRARAEVQGITGDTGHYSDITGRLATNTAKFISDAVAKTPALVFPFMPEEMKKEYADAMDAYDEQSAKDFALPEAQGVLEKTADVAGGLAPMIAMGPTGVVAAANTGAYDSGIKSAKQGEDAITQGLKAGMGAGVNAAYAVLPNNKILNVATMPLVGTTHRLVSNALTDDPKNYEPVLNAEQGLTDLATGAAIQLISGKATPRAAKQPIAEPTPARENLTSTEFGGDTPKPANIEDSQPISEVSSQNTNIERDAIDSVLYKADAWDYGKVTINGNTANASWSNKLQIFPWLESLGFDATPKDIVKAVSNYRDGKRLGTTQKIIAEKAIEYETDILKAEQQKQTAIDTEMQAERNAIQSDTGDTSFDFGNNVKTETVDKSGWTQDVGIEGTNKPQTIGGIQKQGGKAIGTGELVDNFTPDPQITFLNAGVPGWQELKNWYTRKTTPLQPVAPITPEGRVLSELDNNRQANNSHNKLNLQKIGEMFYRGGLDTAGNIRNQLNKMGKAGQSVVARLDALAGQHAIVKDRMEGMEKTVRSMSLREQQAMSDLIAMERDIDIAKYRNGADDKYTFLFGSNPADIVKARQDYAELRGLSAHEMATAEKAAEEYFTRMQEIPDVLLKEGLITPEQHAGLTQYKYSPKQFLEKIDPNSYGGTATSIPDSGIQALKDGSDGYFNSNPMELMQEGLARTYARVARNKANRTLYDMMMANPANGIASLKRTSSKDVEIAMMKDGAKYSYFVKPEFAAEWKKSDPLLNQSAATFLQWAFGGKITKMLATGYNPAFALTNIPRDVLLVYLQSNPKGYSTILPKAFVEMSSDFVTTAKDVFGRKGRFKEFLEEGGVRELLTDQGKFGDLNNNATHFFGKAGEKARQLRPDLNRAQKILGYINETSELWTRLAYRERMIKNGMSKQEASDAAASYLDFSRGGSVTKLIDNVIPYTNAAIQGARSFGRASKNNPGMMAAKLGQLTAAVAGIYAYNMMNSDAYQSVSERDKEANFILTFPSWWNEGFKYTDKNGDTRYPYIKISKEQSIRPILSAIEMGLDKITGKEVSTTQLGLALKDASPISATRKPPLVAAIDAYDANINSFTREPLWKGQDVKPSAEYTQNTPTGYRKIGKALNISPERTKGFVDAFIPQSNAYIDIIGTGLSAMIDKLDGKDKSDIQQAMYENIRKTIPGGTRILGSGNASNAYQVMKDAQRDANTVSTEKTVLRNELASEYRHVSNTGGDNNAVIDKIEAAYKQGQLTDNDIKIIVNKIKVPPIVQKFERLPLSQALDVFIKTNSNATRALMQGFLEDKINRFANDKPEEFQKLMPKVQQAADLIGAQ